MNVGIADEGFPLKKIRVDNLDIASPYLPFDPILQAYPEPSELLEDRAFPYLAQFPAAFRNYLSTSFLVRMIPNSRITRDPEKGLLVDGKHVVAPLQMRRSRHHVNEALLLLNELGEISCFLCSLKEKPSIISEWSRKSPSGTEMKPERMELRRKVELWAKDRKIYFNVVVSGKTKEHFLLKYKDSTHPGSSEQSCWARGRIAIINCLNKKNTGQAEHR